MVAKNAISNPHPQLEQVGVFFIEWGFLIRMKAWMRPPPGVLT